MIGQRPGIIGLELFIGRPVGGPTVGPVVGPINLALTDFQWRNLGPSDGLKNLELGNRGRMNPGLCLLVDVPPIAAIPLAHAVAHQ